MLRRALAQGVRWGWLGVNVAASTTPPRIPQPTIAPPSTADLGRVLRRAAETDAPLACYLTLAAATGARRSELIALRWHDVDLDYGTVRIERGIVSGFDGLVEKDTKTHSVRRVALDAGTVTALAVHRVAMAERAEFFGASIGERSFVFSHDADCSRPWHPDSVSRAFKRACLREGLPDARLHDLRHFVASQLLSAGVDVRTVAGRLGHRNAATTLNVYAHFLEQADRGAADVMGRLIAVDPPAGAGS